MDLRVAFALLVILAFGVLLLYVLLRRISERESPEKVAGRIGEKYANNLIRDILNDDDYLMTNVRIRANGQEAEIDSLIINSYGIFIIEVKNYNGALYGGEDDHEWSRIKVTSAGYSYVSEVRNPIRQVNRQVYILSQFLKQQGFRIWIEGFVFLVRDNSPVDSPRILHDEEEIDETIHRGPKLRIDADTKQRLIKVLCRK